MGEVVSLHERRVLRLIEQARDWASAAKLVGLRKCPVCQADEGEPCPGKWHAKRMDAAIRDCNSLMLGYWYREAKEGRAPEALSDMRRSRGMRLLADFDLVGGLQ